MLDWKEEVSMRDRMLRFFAASARSAFCPSCGMQSQHVTSQLCSGVSRTHLRATSIYEAVCSCEGEALQTRAYRFMPDLTELELDKHAPNIMIHAGRLAPEQRQGAFRLRQRGTWLRETVRGREQVGQATPASAAAPSMYS